MTITLEDIPELALPHQALWQVKTLAVDGRNPVKAAMLRWKHKEMKTKLPPLSDDIPAILREELERVPAFTPEMEAELAKANRELEADPAFQADFLKSRFVERMLQAIEERGETKARVAGRLGKSRQYVQKLFDEDKRVNFTIETLCAIAHTLGRRVHLEVLKPGERAVVIPSVVPYVQRENLAGAVAEDPPASKRRR